jgi:L-aspartate oxidase
VVTDLSGATALPGLWAAGEVACTGVHGANRLASNSLLEGMVFGARLAEAIRRGEDAPVRSGVMAAVLDQPDLDADPGGVVQDDRDDLSGGAVHEDLAKARDQLQRAMFEGAGVVRSAASLAEASATVETIGDAVGKGTPRDRTQGELSNLVTAARALLTSAAWRVESRGAHARSDFPEISEQWRRRIVQRGGRVTVLSEAVGPSGSTGPGSMTKATHH